MAVRFQLFRSSSLVLISVPASPALQYWTQSTGLYVGGSEAAFVARYPAPATFVVSI